LYELSWISLRANWHSSLWFEHSGQPFPWPPQAKAHAKRFHDGDGQTFVWEIRIHLDTPITGNAACYYIQKLPLYPIALGPVGFSIHGYALQRLRARHMGTVGSHANMKRLASCFLWARLQIAGQSCNKWPVNHTRSKQFGQFWKSRKLEMTTSTQPLACH
jgi:hypothetical protein